MILQDLMRLRGSSGGAEQAIASYVLAHRDELGHLSSREVARAVHVAPSTVVRLCQRLGFAGYGAFREALATELARLTSHFEEIDPNYPFDFGEAPAAIARRIGALYQGIIDDTLGMLDADAFERAIRIVDAAREVIVCSTGVELDSARSFRNKMLKIGRSVSLESQVSAAFYRAVHAQGTEVAFVLLSYSGESERLLRVARQAAARGLPVIAITSYGGNSLSALATVSLFVSTRETLERNLGHFAMNLSTMLLLDALYSCVFNKDYFENFSRRLAATRAYARSHEHAYELPGDALEGRARNTVPPDGAR